MVWIRKLDGLLTEPGCAIDGNWTVYWWKESSQLMEAVQQIFFILRSWKCDFAEFRNPRFSGHLAIFNSFFSILEAKKFDFCRVVKPSVQDLQASCEQILRILASSQIVRKFPSFFMPKNALMRSSEIQVSTAPSFVCANFLHVPNFSILAAWKCDLCRFVKSTFQGTTQIVKIIYPFEAWKCDFS